MRMRLYSTLLRKRKTTVTRKEKMDSRRRGKRKSPSQDIIFEVSDNDISSENSEDECNEPEAKISKIDVNCFMSKLNDLSNLQNNKESLNVENSEPPEQENSFEIAEHISVSNSTAESCSGSESDIIVISEDNIDVINDSEECYSAPRAESIENSEDKSIDSNEIIDITDENTEYLKDPVPVSEKNPDPNNDKNPDPNKERNSDVKEDCNEETLKVKENLEDGELEDTQVEVQLEEPIDVTDSPSVEINVPEKVEDELDKAKSDPCICITFNDRRIADQYKTKFLKFLQGFVELEVQNSEGLSIRVEEDATLNPEEWVVLDDTMSSKEEKEQEIPDKTDSPLDSTPDKVQSKKRKKKKNKKEKELFILDTNPSENENGIQFTKYSTKFLIDTIEKADAEDVMVKISAQTCFNCNSNHAIKDCPLPKDFAKINAARQRFKSQKQTARYHLEEDQKYSHLKPGKISDNLREALGLRRHQLPPFIYHMRILGYPPGWLEEAKFVHSNLAMFDTDGKNVRGSTKKLRGLDSEKIVEFPGFNVPLEKNSKDEHRQYRVPPYSEMFSKQAMVDYFEKHFAEEQDDMETCDMDVDEEKEKTSGLDVTEEPIINPLLNELKEIDTSMPSPSLTDLEKQKEKLLAALEDNSSSNPKSVDTAGEDPENSTDQGVPLNKALEVDVEKTDEFNTSLMSPPLNSSINCVKNSMFGTPILKSSSPYAKLPHPDNFMKDVSPVINFENLPNSTGKYEQMTGVLQKVRSTLKGLQNCNS